MAALPYMPFYPADYFADAHHLTTIEHGAYFLLITSYWMRGEPLPDDDRKLSKLTKLTTEEWSDMRVELAEFFDVSDGLWRHKRIDADLARVKDKVEQARNAGKASAERRANARSTDVEQTFNERSTILKPKPKSDSSPNGEQQQQADEIVLSAWNRVADACGLSRAEKMTEVRKSKLRGRLKEYSVEQIVGAIESIESSSFLLGNGERGFKATLDFVLQAKSLPKLIEGDYHGRTGKRSAWLNA